MFAVRGSRFAVRGSRFARTSVADSGEKNQAGKAVAAGSALQSTCEGDGGAGSGDAGTPSAGNFTGGFISGTGSGRFFTGSLAGGEGSDVAITGSRAGGEVPALLSRIPVMAELVPLPGSHKIASASPVPVLAGKFRRCFRWFPQRRNSFRPAPPAFSCHGDGETSAAPQVALLLCNRVLGGLVAQQQGYFELRT